MSRIVGVLATLVVTAGLWAQPGRSAVEQRARLFNDYLVRRARELTQGSLAGIQSAEDLARRRPELRRQLLSMLGLDPVPRKTPLQAQVTGSFERDTYRVEKLVFQSLPSLYVTANLYLPKRVSGRLPTVLYLSGHSPSPAGAKVQYQHHGIWLARSGYVALLLDTNEFGEVPGLHHGTHDLEMWYWLSLGFTPAGPEVWNAMRALDYLETRPEVDPKRVALTGISGGGAITWFTAAVDERFQVAVPVCATWTVQHQVALDTVRGNCDCIYFHNTFLTDLTAAGALIAPRPLKMLSARRDSVFPPAGYREAYRQIRRVYELAGAAEKVAEYDYDAPHSDILPFRKEAYEWINRWLKNDSTPFDEGDIQREEPASLRVLDRFPAGAVNDHIHKTFIPLPRLQAPRSLPAWKQRRTGLLAQLRDQVFHAWPSAKVPFSPWKGKDTGWISRYADASNVEFTTEEGIRVHGQLWVPRDGRPSHPALIYAKGADDVVYPIDYDQLLPALASHVVLVLNPRAVDYPANNFQRATWKRTAALLGATLESMQVWDILRAVDYLTEAEGLKLDSVSVYGRQHMGALGLCAAAFDERITRVILDDPPPSHWQGPALLNVLRVTDLPEIAALMAPREIVSLTPWPASYSLTSSLFALYGKKSALRRAQALADALVVWARR